MKLKSKLSWLAWLYLYEEPHIRTTQCSAREFYLPGEPEPGGHPAGVGGGAGQEAGGGPGGPGLHRGQAGAVQLHRDPGHQRPELQRTHLQRAHRSQLVTTYKTCHILSYFLRYIGVPSGFIILIICDYAV